MIDVMSVCSDERSVSAPEDEVRNSVFGGSELDSESCVDQCGGSRPAIDSRIDPVRFYEDSDHETSPETPTAFIQPDLSLATFITDLYHDRRRQVRVESKRSAIVICGRWLNCTSGLDDIVLLFAIPLRKRDGTLNKQWYVYVVRRL